MCALCKLFALRITANANTAGDSSRAELSLSLVHGALYGTSRSSFSRPFVTVEINTQSRPIPCGLWTKRGRTRTKFGGMNESAAKMI